MVQKTQVRQREVFKFSPFSRKQQQFLRGGFRIVLINPMTCLSLMGVFVPARPFQ